MLIVFSSEILACLPLNRQAKKAVPNKVLHLGTIVNLFTTDLRSNDDRVFCTKDLDVGTGEKCVFLQREKISISCADKPWEGKSAIRLH